MKQHKIWIDKNNYGLSHCGIHLQNFPRNLIRFDVFHLRSAIMRALLCSIRDFIRGQSYEIIEDFKNILYKFWNTHYVSIWSANKSLSSLKGNDIKAFIKHIPSIIFYLKETFQDTDYITNICKALEVWTCISSFLFLTNVIDINSSTKKDEISRYESAIGKFKNNVIKFYEYRSETFLTNTSVGDKETFYMHCLRFYIPVIVDKT